MANTTSVVVASVLISLVAGAGLAFVALPSVYPSLQTTSSNKSRTIQTVEKSWQDESYLFDNELNWKAMNQTRLSITIENNSRILAQFSAPFLLTVDSSFTGNSRYEVALVIEGVGNTSEPIIFFDNSAPTGFYRQMSYFPTLTYQTGILSAGTYNCTVQWKSFIDAPGSNQISVSHHNMNSAYHYDRWMIVNEIAD